MNICTWCLSGLRSRGPCFALEARRWRDLLCYGGVKIGESAFWWRFHHEYLLYFWDPSRPEQSFLYSKAFLPSLYFSSLVFDFSQNSQCFQPGNFWISPWSNDYGFCKQFSWRSSPTGLLLCLLEGLAFFWSVLIWCLFCLFVFPQLLWLSCFSCFQTWMTWLWSCLTTATWKWREVCISPLGLRVYRSLVQFKAWRNHSRFGLLSAPHLDQLLTWSLDWVISNEKRWIWFRICQIPVMCDRYSRLRYPFGRSIMAELEFVEAFLVKLTLLR